MSGMASFMTSPSARTTKRSTPCVEGCWGPMLRVMSSVESPPSACGRCTSTSKPVSPILGRLQQAFPRGRDAVVLLGFDEVLAQRVAGPVFRHEDATEVGMVGKHHAQQVEHLALRPVGVAPDARHAGNDWIVPLRPHLEREEVTLAVGVEVVDHLDQAPLGIVDAREIGEAVELETGL